MNIFLLIAILSVNIYIIYRINNFIKFYKHNNADLFIRDFFPNIYRSYRSKIISFLNNSSDYPHLELMSHITCLEDYQIIISHESKMSTIEKKEEILKIINDENNVDIKKQLQEIWDLSEINFKMIYQSLLQKKLATQGELNFVEDYFFEEILNKIKDKNKNDLSFILNKMKQCKENKDYMYEKYLFLEKLG